MNDSSSRVWWIVGAIVVVIIIVIAAFSYGSSPAAAPVATTTPATASADEASVRATVTAFGQQLQMVSLLAPTTTAAQAMLTSYAPYVAPELLAAWESDPSQAPGKLTSSPWPDHIDITGVTANAGGYAVTGNVIDMTSVEQTSGGNAGSYPVSMTLENRNGQWLITSFSGYPSRPA